MSRYPALQAVAPTVSLQFIEFRKHVGLSVEVLEAMPGGGAGDAGALSELSSVETLDDLARARASDRGGAVIARDGNGLGDGAELLGQLLQRRLAPGARSDSGQGGLSF